MIKVIGCYGEITKMKMLCKDCFFKYNSFDCKRIVLRNESTEQYIIK